MAARRHALLAAAILALAGAMPAVAQAATACPSQDFKAFYAAFADSAELQRAFTARPLASDTIDAAADPEPRTVTTMLDGAALAFPVLPTAAERKHDRLETRIATLSATEFEVTLAVADTDQQLRFLFRKTACWELYRKADDSL
ncbi:hypothetical protein E9232_007025 [Inquilinus ginsengisoli]|uniref:DUF3828 domain-containing protein n=1 Tax=Inquilinus ginsengisoli TaxID=363840 RepID=A0ABU1K0S3_9PROT|nr:hypothetical protein [Inquilinus ginsengisoli]MDR6294471.1 hypothetical protein [Inquilinus ginsengisoli]